MSILSSPICSSHAHFVNDAFASVLESEQAKYSSLASHRYARTQTVRILHACYAGKVAASFMEEIKVENAPRTPHRPNRHLQKTDDVLPAEELAATTAETESKKEQVAILSRRVKGLQIGE